MNRKLIPPAVTALCLAIVPAANAMTISLGSAQLTDRLAVTEPVTVSCSPFDPSLALVSEDLTVSVQQASGRTIAHGSASNYSFAPDYLFACDNSQTTIPVTVLADTAGGPFHGGPALITVSAHAGAATPCWPGSTTCFTDPGAMQSVSAGPTSLNLH